MNKIPVGDKIIVSLIDKKDEKIGSVIIPGTANADLRYGKVEAVSQELKEIYGVGDIVIYPNKSGVGQLIEGKPCLWLRAMPMTTDVEVWGIEKDHSVVDKGDDL